MTTHSRISISFVVATLLLIGAGCVNTPENVAPPEKNTKIEVSGTDSVRPPVAQWKTYKNTEIGFDVSYPSNWTVEDKGVESAGIWINPPDFKMPQSGTVVPYFALGRVAHEPATGEKPVSKQFGVRAGNVYTKGNVVFFPNVNGTAGGYEIQYRAGEKEVEQMLTTFKFFPI